MDTSWNIGSIGIAGPPLRGPSSGRLIAEPPLSPPVSPGSSPVASAQPLEPSAHIAPPVTPSDDPAPSDAHDLSARPATSLESLLMRFRLITPDQLDEALREKRETGRDVGEIVVERGWVNEDQLSRLLSYAPVFPPAAEPVVESTEPDAETVEAVEAEAVEAVAAPVDEPEAEAEAVAADAVDTVEAAPAVEPEALEAEVAPADELEVPEVDPFDSPAEPEPSFSAPPVVSPEPEPATPVADEPAPAPVVVPSLTYHIPPALDLVEPETANESEAPSVASTALVPVTPVVEPEADPEPEAQASEEQPEPAALAPVQPAVQEPASVPTLSEPSQPEIAEPTAEPVAEAAAVAEPAPEPALAPEPQTVRFVEPPAIETIARVFVRLSNGERVEAGSFDDMGSAKVRAEEVVRDISQREAGWPFFGGRYLRPETIVSVDVDATVVRYA